MSLCAKKASQNNCENNKKCYTSGIVHHYNNTLKRTYSPYKKAAFTLAEGATHVALSDNQRRYAFILAEAPTHVAHSNNTRRAAFTLAEILITLGIIGVVAAMTMPTLIHKTQNKQLQTAFKSAYSILSQTIINLRAEIGDNLFDRYTVFVSGQGFINSQELYDKFYNSSQLKIIGECEYNGEIRNYNKSDEAFVDRGVLKPKMALTNGMCVDIRVNGFLITLTVDVNGIKGPNILGHDIFFFALDKNDKLLPIKTSKKYTEEELEDLKNSQPSDALAVTVPAQAGDPCSIDSKQKGNGLGCSYYALFDRNPDDPSKGYWESLP